MNPRKVVSGLPPPTIALFLILSVTAVMTAVSGRPAPVLNDRMPRYCFFAASSPRLKVVAVVFNVPPALLVSADSRIQPSWPAAELKVCTLAAGVEVGVAVVRACGAGVHAEDRVESEA